MPSAISGGCSEVAMCCHVRPAALAPNPLFRHTPLPLCWYDLTVPKAALSLYQSMFFQSTYSPNILGTSCPETHEYLVVSGFNGTWRNTATHTLHGSPQQVSFRDKATPLQCAPLDYIVMWADASIL
jgi:hypothetical protein